MAPISLLQPCGSLHRLKPFQTSNVCSSLKFHCRRSRLVVVRASEEPSSSGSSGLESKEASLERLEASIRGKAAPPRPPSAGLAKPIPIRGVTQQQRKVDSQYENMAEWREGQLFPEGWDKMSFGERAKELYLGRRGMLFWANKAAYASAFALLGGWILFRFVGPALGIYKLAGDFQ